MSDFFGESLTEQFGIVGDNAVDAPLGKALHVSGSVDGPDDYFLSRAFYLANEVGVNEIIVRDDIGQGKLGPEVELGRGLANQTQGNSLILGLDAFQNFGHERADHQTLARIAATT